MTQAPTAAVVRIITRLNVGGPSIQVIGLTRDLRPAGFETRLVHGQLAPGEGDMTTYLPLEGLDAVQLPHLVRSIAPGQDLRTWWRLYGELRRVQPRIVHTHQAKAGTLGRLAAIAYNATRRASRRARVVHTYHGHVFEGYFGRITSAVFIAIERLLARRTDAIIAISGRIRHALLDSYHIGTPDKIVVIPLGFDLDALAGIDDRARQTARAALGVPERATVVATVGRLTEIKQPDLFLQMAQAVSLAVPDAVFLLVGDGELRPALEAQAVAAGLSDRVRFLGWRGDLTTIYGATDVFVLTSRNEGTPVALIEAMAAGVASVSTDVGGVGDVMPTAEVGVRVAPDDRAAMADAVVALATDAARRRLVGEAARRSVLARYQVARLRADIVGLYRRLLAPGSTISRTP